MSDTPLVNPLAQQESPTITDEKSAGTPSTGDITENISPGVRNPYKVEGTHDQETRKRLALIILWPLVGLYVVIVVAFLINWISTSELTAATAAISGFQVLAAAAVGFYFGSKE